MIIQQPNGKFAIWSGVVDDITAFNLDAEELINMIADEEREKVAARTRETIEKIRAGKNPYYQFRISWEEASKKLTKKERERASHVVET